MLTSSTQDVTEAGSRVIMASEKQPKLTFDSVLSFVALSSLSQADTKLTTSQMDAVEMGSYIQAGDRYMDTF